MFGACPSFTTWGKTGVSCDNLPLLFLNVFQSDISLVHQNVVLCGNGLTLYHTIPTLNVPVFKNVVGKGENAGNQAYFSWSFTVGTVWLRVEAKSFDSGQSLLTAQAVVGGYFFQMYEMLFSQNLTLFFPRRVLIVDWDVHHGQATQQMFYDDPR